MCCLCDHDVGGIGRRVSRVRWSWFHFLFVFPASTVVALSIAPMGLGVHGATAPWARWFVVIYGIPETLDTRAMPSATVLWCGHGITLQTQTNRPMMNKQNPMKPINPAAFCSHSGTSTCSSNQKTVIDPKNKASPIAVMLSPWVKSNRESWAQ